MQLECTKFNICVGDSKYLTIVHQLIHPRKTHVQNHHVPDT